MEPQGGQPYVGDLRGLLAHADKHLGAKVRVTGTIDWVAEGGPMLGLVDPRYGSTVLVLFDTRLYGGSYALDFDEQRHALVVGTFLPLTAENIDSVGNPVIGGAAVLGMFDPGGSRTPTHLLIARRIVQSSGIKYPAGS